MVFGNFALFAQWLCDLFGDVWRVDLQTVMDHVGWKTPSTARHCLRMEPVIRSGGAGDSLAELPLDLVELYRKQNELTGFTRAFEMIVGDSGNG